MIDEEKRLRKNQRNREWHSRNRTACHWCGDERPYPSKSMYCSDECRKAAKRAINIKAKQRIRDEFSAYKLARGCSRCGYRKCAAALDFHHLDPITKSARRFECVSVKSQWFQEEAAKCILLCANCHKEEHHG
jgi:hypothetical protein